tara:strand:- start:5674 stop:5901 length:228 start_codon:yes stop_codon:yes gene_type:complete
MGKIIQFPTVKEAEKLRKDMTELEGIIKSNLDQLQDINEEIIQLTVAYEEMLYKLCDLTGVEIPNNMDWDEPPKE